MPSGNHDLPGVVIPATRAATTGSGSALRFPAEEPHYYTIINFLTYSRLNPKTVAQKRSQADVILPLPLNLREYYAVTYGDVDFDKLGGALDAGERLVNEYMSEGGVTSRLIDDFAKAGVGAAQLLARRTANYFSDDASGLIDRVTGSIVNPHITAVFRGVALREHQFTWRLHARTAAESRTLRTIINYIRDRSLPTRKGDFLLNFPDEAYVGFFAADKKILYPMFKSVVASVDIPSSSDNTNAFFKGTDEPVFVELSVTFKEVEAATREDYSPSAGLLGNSTGGTGSPPATTGSGTGTLGGRV